MDTDNLPAPDVPKPFTDEIFENLAVVVAQDPIEPTERDLQVIEEMAAIGCTPKEICGVLKIPLQIFKSLVQIEDACYRGSSRATTSLRRLQWRTAQRNPIMQIFLGKQILGQADKVEHKDDGRAYEKAQQEFANKLKNIINVTPTGKTPKPAKRKTTRSRAKDVVDVGEGLPTASAGVVADVVVHGGSGERENS